MKPNFISLFALTTALISLNGFAKETCKSLQQKADDTCEESICEEAKKDGYTCEKDGDFYEGHQICAYEEFQELLKVYNRRHPRAKLACED